MYIYISSAIYYFLLLYLRRKELCRRCGTDAVYVMVAVRQADAGNTAMYAGLAVAVLIFLVVVSFIVCLVRRRLPLFISQFFY